MDLKNCLKNVVKIKKIEALQEYRELFSVNNKNGKMSEERQQELFAKVEMVVSNNPSAVLGTESDIKVYRNSVAAGSEIVIDIVVNWMETNEEEDDRMDMSYAAAYTVIKDASLE